VTTATGQGPSIRRRRLRSELRQRREAAEMTQEQVAEAMDWSLSKLIRIESGAVGISTNDLKALLNLYGVKDRHQIDAMVELAKASRQRMWWSAYKDAVSPQLISYIGYEAEAVVMRQFHFALMPGLLQTEAYARTVIFDSVPGELTGEARRRAERQLEVRMRRGQEVLNRDDPPELYLVLDEAAIRRQVGGPAVMREQLNYLATLANRPTIELRILPFERGAHPGVNGAFTILEFADPAVGDVLYLDAMAESMIKEAPSNLDYYHRVFQKLQQLALDPADSLALVERVKDELA